MLSRYRKTVAAVVGGVITWAYTALSDDRITTLEYVGLAAAIATAFGVYQIANDAPEGEPADPAVSERGDIGILGLVILAVVVLLLIGLIRGV